MADASDQLRGDAPLTQRQSAVGAHPAAVQFHMIRQTLFTGSRPAIRARDQVSVDIAQHQDFRQDAYAPKFERESYHRPSRQTRRATHLISSCFRVVIRPSEGRRVALDQLLSI